MNKKQTQTVTATPGPGRTSEFEVLLDRDETVIDKEEDGMLESAVIHAQLIALGCGDLQP